MFDTPVGTFVAGGIAGAIASVLFLALATGPMLHRLERRVAYLRGALMRVANAGDRAAAQTIAADALARDRPSA